MFYFSRKHGRAPKLAVQFLQAFIFCKICCLSHFSVAGAAESKLSVKKKSWYYFSRNEERTLIVTTDMHFLIGSDFYATFYREKTRRFSILLNEWRIWQYITKLHVNFKDSNKLLQSLVSLNFRH